MSHRNLSEPDDTRPSPECEDFALLITEYIEGEGGADLCVELEAHSRVCPHCAEILRSYVATMRTCQGGGRVIAPKGTHKKLWDKLTKDIAALRVYSK